MDKVSIWSNSNLIYKNKKAESFTFLKKNILISWEHF